ncbi:MAG TPA: trypsin-like peptidase domain-containing protein, partial [Solirubrobacteraceae bacterium]
SAILRRLNEILPPSGPILHALARFDPLPSIKGPEADVPPPSKGVLADRRIRSAFGSVVRVTGTACGLGIEGSGWAAGSGLVVTNAHVVAGESDTAVQVGGDGPHLAATPVVFDPHDDIAVLRVDGLGVRPLTLARSPASGGAVAILGYPEDGPFDARPGRLGATAVVASQDAYGRGPVRRSITSFRGLVRPGNSGGPVIDRAGHVAATVFAATVGGPLTGGLGVPNAIVRRELAAARAGHAVDTGPCAG